jgi:tRNA-2-methylthio-N6-dimethylallyladenosine synthase
MKSKIYAASTAPRKMIWPFADRYRNVFLYFRTFVPVINSRGLTTKKKYFIETYGCQMNFSDSEIIASVLSQHDYEWAGDIAEADIIFLNTCSIREHAEQRIFNKLDGLRARKKKNPGLVIGILGCMAERLKEDLLHEKDCVDLVAGPDAYRTLPELLQTVYSGQKSINVILSADETYADIQPVRIGSDGVTAFISIMRGCTNYCSYCVVPYVRGVERSRNPDTIITESRGLFAKGYREITLLGQNVNSYTWAEGTGGLNFAGLIGNVAAIDPLLRVRFATSHPKDLSDELLETIARHENIGRCIHLPLQSGSDRILQLMNRKYDRTYYMNRVKAIRSIIPGCSVTTDIIAGFCSETENDHKQTLEVMREAGFDYAYMFKYSERPGTPAAAKYPDDVPEEVKSERLKEIIDLQQEMSFLSNQKDIGLTFRVLAEAYSRRSSRQLSGRNSQNKMVVFPAEGLQPGDYASISITRCTAATLLGVVQQQK